MTKGITIFLNQKNLGALMVANTFLTLNIMKNLPFKTKDDIREFIYLNIPFAVKPTKPAKTTYVSTFTSQNAMDQVIDGLTEKIWEKINQE